jgi:hemerythrin
LQEHRGEHRRVLAELRTLGQRAAAGRLALGRAYVRERLPDWFALHAATMDSALAAHLKERPKA